MPRTLACTLLVLALQIPALAGQEKDSSGPKVFTNEDLKTSEGNLTFSEPGEESSYEAMLPREKPDPGAAVKAAEIAKMKERYQEQRRRADRLEEVELPAAREAADREVGNGWVLVNGIPTRVLVEHASLPMHEKLEKLEKELATVKAEIAQIEAKAKRLGLGRPALMQR